MDSFTLSDDFFDDLVSALEPDNVPAPLPFNGEEDEDLFAMLQLPADIAIEPVGNPMVASFQDFVYQPGINPIAFRIDEMESRAFHKDLELRSEIATVTQLEVNPMPSFSTPGFVALQTSQAPVTSARRPRKPREYVPRSINGLLVANSNVKIRLS